VGPPVRSRRERHAGSFGPAPAGRVTGGRVRLGPQMGRKTRKTPATTKFWVSIASLNSLGSSLPLPIPVGYQVCPLSPVRLSGALLGLADLRGANQSAPGQPGLDREPPAPARDRLWTTQRSAPSPRRGAGRAGRFWMRGAMDQGIWGYPLGGGNQPLALGFPGLICPADNRVQPEVPERVDRPVGPAAEWASAELGPGVSPRSGRVQRRHQFVAGLRGDRRPPPEQFPPGPGVGHRVLFQRASRGVGPGRGGRAPLVAPAAVA